MAAPSRKSDTKALRATPKPGVTARARLKRAGGSLVMTVPASARDALGLTEGQEMAISVQGDTLVLTPTRPERPQYLLADLLAQCAPDMPRSDEERTFADAPPVGRELW